MISFKVQKSSDNKMILTWLRHILFREFLASQTEPENILLSTNLFLPTVIASQFDEKI